MIIKILGSGCPNCKKLEKNVMKALDALGKEADIIKVTDIQDIMAYNVMATPALVLDEKVLFSGQVPGPDKLQALLS